MEAAGLAIGVFGLYEVVKKCIAVVSRAQNFSKQAAKMRVKYLIEEVRLQHWAQSWGYPDGTRLDTNLKTFSPALYQVAIITLREIYNALQDTTKLRDRYGIESSLASQAQIPPLLSRAWTAPTAGSLENFGISLISNVDESNDLPDTSPTSTGITLLRRTIWAINGASKFEALVKDLKEWNDSLACFQPPRQQEFADLALMAALINQRDLDHTLVPQILDTLEEDGPAVLGETASLKRYNEFLEANVLKPVNNIQRKDLDLPEANFIPDVTHQDGLSEVLRVQSYHYRQNGVYRPSSELDSDPLPVIVEWKILPGDVKQEYKIISRSRIQNIALLMHKSTKRPNGFCTLPCIGILSKINDGTQGLVFELPQSATETDPPSNKPYCSLHELLPNMSNKQVSVYEPPLQHRFSLANELCNAFLIFHSADVVHKRFSSHDVVFSHPLEDITTSEGSSGLQQPVITGFGFSRPVDDGFGSISVDAIPSVVISNDALATLESSLYAHHSVIGRSPVNFSSRFDIYSLGLVLLEIGLWTRLEELLPSKNTLRKLGIEGPVCTTTVFVETFHYTLIGRYLPRLNVTMGGIYETVVRWCLEEQFENERGLDQDSKVQEAFYWKVVNKLAKCKI